MVGQIENGLILDMYMDFISMLEFTIYILVIAGECFNVRISEILFGEFQGQLKKQISLYMYEKLKTL